jgi:ligand-binding sensor domain-containing protein
MKLQSQAGWQALPIIQKRKDWSNNVVGSIMEDKIGNLWFGTNVGFKQIRKRKAGLKCT